MIYFKYVIYDLMMYNYLDELIIHISLIKL